MGLNFTDGTHERVNLGDITAARFLDLSAWTFFCFARFVSFTDERTVIAKDNSSGTKQFHLKSETNGSLEVQFNATGFGTSASDISTDTWYLCAVTNDGTGSATAITIYLIDMTGAVVASATGDHGADASTLTADLKYGSRRTTSDEMDGDLANGCYIESELTQAQLQEAALFPYRVALRHGALFFNPLDELTTSVDWTGNGHTGSHENSPALADNPPVGSMVGFDLGAQGTVLGAAVAGGRIMGSIAGGGGLAGEGGIAGRHGGLAA